MSPVLTVEQPDGHAVSVETEGEKGLFSRLLRRKKDGADPRRHRGSSAPPRPVSNCEESTSVLASDDARDESTTTLGVVGRQLALLRVSTGERYRLSVPVVLGKGSMAGCVIAGNPAISRRHAEVREIEGGYYMVDNGSTNGTWVDEVRVAPGQPQALRDGSTVVLADESFTFLITP